MPSDSAVGREEHSGFDGASTRWAAGLYSLRTLMDPNLWHRTSTAFPQGYLGDEHAGAAGPLSMGELLGIEPEMELSCLSNAALVCLIRTRFAKSFSVQIWAGSRRSRLLPHSRRRNTGRQGTPPGTFVIGTAKCFCLKFAQNSSLPFPFLWRRAGGWKDKGLCSLAREAPHCALLFCGGSSRRQPLFY